MIFALLNMGTDAGNFLTWSKLARGFLANSNKGVKALLIWASTYSGPITPEVEAAYSHLHFNVDHISGIIHDSLLSLVTGNLQSKLSLEIPEAKYVTDQFMRKTQTSDN